MAQTDPALAKIERAIDAMKKAQCPSNCDHQARLIRLYEQLAEQLRAETANGRPGSVTEMLKLVGFADSSGVW